LQKLIDTFYLYCKNMFTMHAKKVQVYTPHLFLCLCKDSWPLSSLSLDSELDEELSDEEDEDEEQLELSDAKPDDCSKFTLSATAAKSGLWFLIYK